MYLYNHAMDTLINTDNIVSIGFHRVDIDSFESKSDLIRIAVTAPKYEYLCDLPAGIDPNQVLQLIIHTISLPENKNKIAKLNLYYTDGKIHLFKYY